MTASEKDRAETRRLAQAVVDAVTNDEKWPTDFDLRATRDSLLAYVEGVVFEMAQEIVALTGEIKAQSKRAEDAFDYLEFHAGDTQILCDAEEIFLGNLDKDGNRITRKAQP